MYTRLSQSIILQVFLKDLAEMKTINRKCYSKGEKTWPTEQGPEEQLPVMKTFFPDYPQHDN